jgi:NADH:ubiquinone reductase (H+-translocating)
MTDQITRAKAVIGGGYAELIPGVAEFAYPIGELEPAQRLRAKLDSMHSDAWITVVGAGPTGIETAAELAGHAHKVTLVCGGRLGPALSQRARRSTANWLATRRVVVLESNTVVEVRSNAVVFADGAVRPSALTIWTVN